MPIRSNSYRYNRLHSGFYKNTQGDRLKGSRVETEISPEDSKVFPAEAQMNFREVSTRNGCSWGTYGHRVNSNQDVFEASISVDETDLASAVAKIRKTIDNSFPNNSVRVVRVKVEIEITK